MSPTSISTKDYSRNLITGFILPVGLLLIGVAATVRLELQDSVITQLYDQEGDVRFVYSSGFLARHVIIQINAPVQSVSDEFLQNAYGAYFFAVTGRQLSRDVLNQISTRTFYLRLIDASEGTGRRNAGLIGASGAGVSFELMMWQISQQQDVRTTIYRFLILSQLSGVIVIAWQYRRSARVEVVIKDVFNRLNHDESYGNPTQT